MKIFDNIVQSAKELKSIKTIVVVSMLVALIVVLSFSNFYILNTLRVSFTFIPIVIASTLFGPIVGGITGVLGDVLGYFTSQAGHGVYNIGFTINGFINGFIYGLFLYKRFSPLRVTLAKLLQVIIVEILLTPFWLSFMYGDSYIVLMWGRLFKTVIFIPIEIIVTILISKIVIKYSSKRGLVWIKNL